MVKATEQLIQNPETSQTLADPPPAAASVVGLSKFFGKTSVLENIDFDVAEGEVLVLLGASGSGKTTILRIIAGLEQPLKGRVILHGRDVTDLPARERGVGVIFQSYALFPKMNVEKNIGYGLRIRKQRRKEIRQTVDDLVKLVQLEEHRKKYPSQLSGGQQQRVAIARTLAYKPEVLLFDEPFGALDTQTRSHLRREIRALLKKVRVPSIFITHDQEEALELGDRVAVLNQGHIEQIGTPYEIYNHPATEYVARFLGVANILDAIVRKDFVEVGAAHVPVTLDEGKFRPGDRVKIVFRPEDVVLSRRDLLLPGQTKISPAVIEEIIFVGAYERVRLRLERDGGESIMATRLKPEASGTRLHAGDRVVVAISSFTVLEPQKDTNAAQK
jgi:ABC-type Fe3+/spermidine/putrescine transport system ATPase subunit